jgi:hypothetical protein
MNWGARAAALATAALLAACGQSNGPRVASVGGGRATPSPSASANPAQVYAQYAACIRQHGGNEPDPTVDDVGKPHWQVPLDNIPLAQKQPCFPLLQQIAQRPSGPPDAAMMAAGLKFSQCMRAHGVPTFPDPDPQTGNFPGVQRDAPDVQAGYQQCKQFLPGGTG